MVRAEVSCSRRYRHQNGIVRLGARMGLSLLDAVRWGSGAFIEAVILVLAIRRHLFGRLPFFTVYLFLLIANEAIALTVYEIAGIHSRMSFVVVWLMQGLLIFVRALVVYEICRCLLSPYKGVWRLCRPALILVAIVLVTSAVIEGYRNEHSLAEAIFTAGRSLEFTVVCILTFGLFFCWHYRLRISRHLAWIALGFGFYSTVQVINNTFLAISHPLAHFFIWDALRIASFNIATTFWFVALIKPLPSTQPAPILLRGGEYERFRPVVTARLRELNTRLLEMWK